MKIIHTKSCPRVFVAKGKNKKRKLSPDTGSKRTTFRGAKRRCKSE